MAVRNRIAAPSLAMLALVAGLGVAVAQEAQERGAGASGKGDGSGMGQDTTEQGRPRGPGDKVTAEPQDPRTEPKRLEGTSPEGGGMIKRCDDGRTPVEGVCPS